MEAVHDLWIFRYTRLDTTYAFVINLKTFLAFLYGVSHRPVCGEQGSTSIMSSHLTRPRPIGDRQSSFMNREKVPSISFLELSKTKNPCHQRSRLDRPESVRSGQEQRHKRLLAVLISRQISSATQLHNFSRQPIRTILRETK